MKGNGGFSPAERSLRARIAAHALHAKVSDPEGHTAAARKAFTERFERQVDPDGTLPPAERARRAEHAKSAYFSALALRSVQARRVRNAGHHDALPEPRTRNQRSGDYR